MGTVHEHPGGEEGTSAVLAEPSVVAAATGTLPSVGRWAALHTRPRCEWKVLELLERTATPAFLPTVRKRHTYGGRVRIATLPLFNGYLFYDFDAIARLRVLRAPGVVRVVETQNPQGLASELDSLARALAVEDPVPRRIALGPPGTPVEITSGPFLGCRGELVREQGQTTLVMRIGFLGFGAEVAIDEAFVRAIPPEDRLETL